MKIYAYQQAFGACDKTSSAMRSAVAEWFRLYYCSEENERQDPCQRIAYTVVNKLVKAIFSEYSARGEDLLVEGVLRQLDGIRREAMQLALIGGECYLKPYPGKNGFSFALIPRDRVLIFGRDTGGMPVDIGTIEHSTLGKYHYTLLERRYLEENGCLTIENQLYRSLNAGELGNAVPLGTHPAYSQLPLRYTFRKPMGSVGLVRLKTPMINCVDGSADGVSVYAAAVGLIHNIDRNEAQMNGEFSRGESRILVSRDLLDRDGLQDHVFVGLDEDPEQVGITTFAPALREQAFLARKQEYLRNVETIVGLKRGMLSEVNLDQRTATEIAYSMSEYSLTVMDFQRMWQEALIETVQLCAVLAELYGFGRFTDSSVYVDWGNGVLYDEEKQWQSYLEMVRAGLLKPELALAWRFGLPAKTEADIAQIRSRYMPESCEEGGVRNG